MHPMWLGKAQEEQETASLGQGPCTTETLKLFSATRSLIVLLVSEFVCRINRKNVAIESAVAGETRTKISRTKKKRGSQYDGSRRGYVQVEAQYIPTAPHRIPISGERISSL